MEFARYGPHTPESWDSWPSRNVAVTDAGVTVASEDSRSFVSPVPAFERAVDVVDIAVDGTGCRFVLDANGDVYRQDDPDGAATRLGCLWTDGEDPRAIGVTRDTIYVAWGAPAAVQAYSRHLEQTRWFARDVVDPVAFAVASDAVYLLDRGPSPGRGVLRRLRRHGMGAPAVFGLASPRDAAVDDAGNVYVLCEQLRTAESAPARPLVRRFDREALASPPARLADTVLVPPEAFRVRSTGDSFEPSCIAVGAPGELVAGVAPDWEGEQTLVRYRPTDAAFDRQASYKRGCHALVWPSGGDSLLAVDGEGTTDALSAVRATRRNEGTGGFDAQLLTRFDAGAVSTAWHRLALDVADVAADTQVRVAYHATDGERPPLPSTAGRAGGDIEDVRGIGPVYARRLREAGIDTPADLVGRDPLAIATLLGVEEVDVSRSRATDWVTAARSAAADAGATPPDVAAIEGIGPAYAGRLRAAGIADVAALAAADPTEVAVIASRELLDVPVARIENWLDAAAALVPDPPDFHRVDWREVTPATPTEVLLSEASGRYLWVKLELVGSEFDAPLVRSLDVELPRQSYLDDLPAIYREDPESSAFLERFLALFESVFTDIESEIADFTRYLDPEGIPGGGDQLAWLGSWLAAEFDERWPAAARREFIARAPELYRKRGTRVGLLATIRLYLSHVEVPQREWGPAYEREAEQLQSLVADGHLSEAEAASLLRAHDDIERDEPLVRVVEHASLDCLDEGPARDPWDLLLDCPQGFLVLLHPALSADQVAVVESIVAAQTPAHASSRTVGLRNRTVLGGAGERGERGAQTYLGINTVLPEREFVLEDSGLGYETVLTEREPDGQYGITGRLGDDTRLS